MFGILPSPIGGSSQLEYFRMEKKLHWRVNWIILLKEYFKIEK